MDRKPLNIDEYFKAEANRVRPYRGQMTQKFQDSLADHHKVVTLADCDFYHIIDFTDGTQVQGDWDLRGVTLSGRKVIEYGPASGYLSNAIAKAGADLTIFDLPMCSSPEVMPFSGIDLDEVAQSGCRFSDKITQ